MENKWFPAFYLVVNFRDPLYGISDQITFATGLMNARTYTAKSANGLVLGKLPLQGVTVMSGAQGMLRFQNGTTYSAVLKIAVTGLKGVTISDLTDGRSCMIDF